jgi:hypothetical protein
MLHSLYDAKSALVRYAFDAGGVATAGSAHSSGGEEEAAVVHMPMTKRRRLRQGG